MTVTLRFTGRNEARIESDANLRSMAADSVAKSKARPSIVMKLERVRGLTKIIESTGEAVSEVNTG